MSRRSGLPEHDEDDELEHAVAHDQHATPQEREGMLSALRALRALTGGK